MTRQDRYAVRRVPELVGNSGHMLIHFYSDVAYNMTGFNITFSIDSCPSQRHDLTCSGKGKFIDTLNFRIYVRLIFEFCIFKL